MSEDAERNRASVMDMTQMILRIKRVYAEPDRDDGMRILVDRLWPRGLTKEKAKVDLWLKDVAPSNELRKWFGHDPKKWPEFKRRYKEELKTLGSPLVALREETKQKTVTLLYGAKDQEHNEADVLLACIIHEGAASGRCEREIVAKLHSWLRNVGYLAGAGACLAAPWVRRRFSSAAFPDTQLA